jgi:GntR family transcriptional regulator
LPDQPKYRQIAAALRARIEAGEFDQQGKLPGEAVLRDEYGGVAINTMRQALKALQDEGVVEARHGRGVFLRSFKPIVRNALKRLRSEQWGQGKSIWEIDVEDRDLEADGVSVELVRFQDLDPDLIRILELPPEAQAWRRNRRYLVDGVPVIRSTSYIPDDLARGTRITQIDTGPGGIYKQLSEAGHAPVRFREELRARMPSAGEAVDLELVAGTPVVEMTRYAYDSADRVIEVNRMLLDASRFLLVYDFPA